MTSLIPVLSKTSNILKELVRAVPNVKFHEVNDPDNDPHFQKSEILITDFDLFAPYLYDLPNLKWVQGTWAGIDKLVPCVQKDRPIPFQITRFTGEHFGRLMSEYVVANIVNHERKMFEIRRNQDKCQWVKEGNIVSYRAIYDLTIGILGVGNIGNRIGQLLNTMGAKVLGLGRRPELPSGSEYSYVSKYYTKETLSCMLQESDYIVNVLPNTEETTGLLSGDILKNCAEKRSIFMNIGRSNVASEDSIIKALNNKWLSAVILDVFDEEPLPQDNPLWSMEQVFITPHCAGMTRAKDVAELFRSNLNKYLQKLPLPAIVDLTRGY